jgi:hypothetical protein
MRVIGARRLKDGRVVRVGRNDGLHKICACKPEEAAPAPATMSGPRDERGETGAQDRHRAARADSCYTSGRLRQLQTSHRADSAVAAGGCSSKASSARKGPSLRA